MRALRMAFLMFGFASALAAPAHAADKYPSRPVHFMTGFAAGGPVDIVARVMADWFSADLGQQFVVENRGGSGGNIAVAAVVNSQPDGYTILFDAPNNAISTSLYKKLPFDFIRDTVPVAGIMQLTNIMVVPPSLPVKTVAEFIAYAKARPGAAELRLVRQRHLGAHDGRAVQGHDRT
jgi:tripartite-type tricarboxylate transporter receptor subunit TctC